MRAALELTSRWTATALVVNGWDSSGDVNQMKSVGLQLGYGSERFDASLGYLVGPEERDFVLVPCRGSTGYTRGQVETPCSVSGEESEYPADFDAANFQGLRHLVDVVARANPVDALELLLNLHYGWEQLIENAELEKFRRVWWLGGSLAAQYAFNEQWNVAGRVERFEDNGGSRVDGDLDSELVLHSFTATVVHSPHPVLRLMLDNRLDVADQDVFPQKLRSLGTTQFTTTFGVVLATP